MIPLSVIGGYLGAGKTTFLNRLLAGDHGLRLAVLVNDFGEVNIDASLIASHDGDTYTLTNGCICCSIGDDLSGTLLDIARSENPPDEVVIEASGVADATRFATYSGEWIGFGLRGVVVVADAETIRTKAADKYVGDLVVQQLLGADLIILNKIDLVGETIVDDIERWLDGLGVEAPVIATTEADVPFGVLFDRPANDQRLREANQAANHEAMFATTVVRDDQPWELGRLEAALESLPRSVVRAKGVVRLLDAPKPQLVQLVGRRWKVTDAPASPDAQTEVVLIAISSDQEVEAVGEAMATAARA